MGKVRLGLVGCGVFGESHLRAFRAISIGEIVAVLDTNRERAERLAGIYGNPQVCGSLEELCGMTGVEAVDVATTEEVHLGPVLTALGAGKHVFVEKPMTATVEECTQRIAGALHPCGPNSRGGRLRRTGSNPSSFLRTIV